MKISKLICYCAMVAVLTVTALPTSAHRPHPDYGEMPTELPDDYKVREDARVLLKIPYDIIQGESDPHIYVGLQNLSDTPIRLKWKLGLGDSEYQVYYQARSKPTGENLTRPESIPFWERIKHESEYGYDELGKNEFKIYDYHRLLLRVNYSIMPEGVREMRVGFLVGPNEWVFSDWVPIRRLEDQHLRDGEVIETLDYKGISDPLPIRMKDINGNRYLFYQTIRFAMVPDGATPRFDWDQETRHLTVHFDGVNVPLLIFDASQFQTLEWTPETAPHMVAREELKAELESASDADVPTPEPDPVADPPSNDIQPSPEKAEDTVTPAPPPQSSEAASPEPEAEPSPDSRIWPTLLVLLLIAGGTVLVIKHKRQG